MKEIPLTQGGVALIDDADIELVGKHKWCLAKRNHTFYAKTNIRKDGRHAALYLHRLVINAQPHQKVDHRDGNGLNNCRGNLRVATGSQNNANSHGRKRIYSRFKGVTWHTEGHKWMARISDNRKSIHLGLYSLEADAARAYNVAAIEFFGEYAKLNNIQDPLILPKREISWGKSAYRGVSWDVRAKKWRSEIRHNKQRFYLGLFGSEIDAAKSYDQKAKMLFCASAKLNFPTTLRMETL